MRLVKDTARNKYVFQVDYHYRHIAKDAGFMWNKDLKTWETASVMTAVKLSGYASEDLVDEFREIIDSQDWFFKASSASDSDIQVPVPEGLSYFPFQKAGIDYARRLKRCLIGDEPGMGKTIEAIGLMNMLGLERALIICPATLKLNWKNELEKWSITKFKILIIESQKDVCICDYDIAIINYDRLTSWKERILKEKFDLLICDESHRLKNPKAQRSEIMKKIVKVADRVLFLTGTPILNKPIELFNQLKLLGADLAENWFQFVTRYCAGFKAEFGWVTDGHSNLEELDKMLRKSVMVRRLKKDVMTHLPPKIRQTIELSGAKYKSVIADEKVFTGEGVEHVMNLKVDQLGEIQKLINRTALAKLPDACAHISEMLESHEKIVVFAHHHNVIDVLEQTFRKDCVRIDGRIAPEKRQPLVDRFQSDPEIRLFIGGIKAVGEGITLDKASVVIFVELDWVPGVMIQAEDRLHRGEQRNSVLIQHIVVEDSIDADISKVIVKKQEVIRKAVGQSDEALISGVSGE